MEKQEIQKIFKEAEKEIKAKKAEALKQVIKEKLETLEAKEKQLEEIKKEIKDLKNEIEGIKKGKIEVNKISILDLNTDGSNWYIGNKPLSSYTDSSAKK